MTRDDIIRMAREAGFAHSWSDAAGEALERFASMVAEAEREACAKVCEDEASQSMQCAGSMITGPYDWKADGATDCADAIRARGQA